MRNFLLRLELVECRGGHTGNSASVRLGDLVVFSPRTIGDILGKTGGDEFVFRINAQQVESGCDTKLLGARHDLFLKVISAGLAVLRVLIDLGVKLFAVRHAEGNVGASVRDHDADNLTDISSFLGVQSRQQSGLKGVGKRRTSTARHLFQSVSGHGNRFRGWQEDIGSFALEGDQTNLVTGLVGFHQKTDSSTLCCIHAVQGHGSRGIDNEDNQRTSLSGHLLDSDVTLFDVNTTVLVFGTNGTLASSLLVRRRGTERGIDCKTDNLSFRKHGLDVSTTILRKDETTASSLSVSLSACECNKFGVDRCGVGIEHEFLRNFRDIGCFLFVLFLLIGFLLFFLVFVFVVTVFVLLFVHLWRRWWRRRRGHHIVFVHGSIDKCPTGSNGQFDGQSEILTGDLTAFESSGGTGDLAGENFGTVSLASSSNSFLTKILNLGRSNLQVLDVFAGKDNSGFQIVFVFDRFGKGGFGFCRSLRSRSREFKNTLYSRNTVLGVEGLGIGRKSDSNSIQQVVTKFAFLGVEGSNQKRSARVSQGQTLTFNQNVSVGDNIQQNVGSLFVQEVDIIYVQNTTVSLGQKTRGENRLSGLDRFFQVSTSEQTIFHDVQRHLDERTRNNFGFTFFKRDTAVGHINLEVIIDTTFSIWSNVEW
mmetsp:Transcript_9985/g.20812  ORF Transcript_9985/g.20812 Transcript_9985/m.20812 type:complete len:648 (-) Transcript_9985:538-2481(-)